MHAVKLGPADQKAHRLRNNVDGKSRPAGAPDGLPGGAADAASNCPLITGPQDKGRGRSRAWSGGGGGHFILLHAFKQPER